MKVPPQVTAPVIEGAVIVGLVNVLLVRVCDPVSVATDESILKVTAPEVPPPVKPVPAFTAVISADIPAIALVT